MAKKPMKKRRNRRPQRRKSRIPRAIKMFPKKQLVQLTYCDNVIVPSVDTAVSGPYMFRLNSIFDPDKTSTGHQPRGHDQWSAMYKKYCVVGAKVKVEPLVAGITNIDAVLYGYCDDDDQAEFYTVEDLRELNMNHSKYKYVQLGDSARGVNNTRNANLNFKVGMKNFFGISKNTQIMAASGIGAGDFPAIQDPHGLSAPFGANPTHECFLKLYTSSVGTSANSIRCRVTIDYLVICHDPLEVTQS